MAGKMKDPAKLEQEILESGVIHTRMLAMREALGRYFSMRELQDLRLLDLCRLYCDLPEDERVNGA